MQQFLSKHMKVHCGKKTNKQRLFEALGKFLLLSLRSCIHVDFNGFHIHNLIENMT